MEKLTVLSHLFVTVFLSSLDKALVTPAITDVTMTALCPGQDECSLAIYLSGLQQAIRGVGSVVLMPLIGNLSDKYGRKALLTLPLTVSIIPLVILACSRTTEFFYAYYVLSTLTSMVSDGTIFCLALAYVADNIVERRTAAFGIVSGLSLAANVCGNFAARFLSPALAFQVAALVSMICVVYMRIFLQESVPAEREELTRPILKGPDGNQNLDDGDIPEKAPVFKKISSIGDLISMLKTSVTFTQAAVVIFFHSLAQGGLQASRLYYLKARFHFCKDEYATIFLLIDIGGMISQLFLMPLFAPIIPEEKLLSIGILAGLLFSTLYSIAWAPWVPYAASGFFLFADFTLPALRSIVSKQVGSTEQGKALGSISSISSLANIIAPLIFSPLNALFLSEEAPFYFPGFSFLCIGLLKMISLIQSVMIRPSPPATRHNIDA